MTSFDELQKREECFQALESALVKIFGLPLERNMSLTFHGALRYVRNHLAEIEIARDKMVAAAENQEGNYELLA